MADGSSTWTAVDGDFYRVVFGEDRPTEEEEQQEERMSPGTRAHRMSRAFTRSSTRIATVRPRRPPTSSVPSPAVSVSARRSRPSPLHAPTIAALVDVFRMLQAWDDETS